MRALLLVCALAFLAAGCADDRGFFHLADPAPPPGVSDDHPCPERAIPPEHPSLYDAQIASGEPVGLTLLIPLAGGTPTQVNQGRSSDPTHIGDQAYAWDFAAPEGTAVLAAAPGFVVWVKDDSAAHSPDEAAAALANWIAIDHGGGLYSLYVHLAQGSAQVSPGELVAAGDHLADTGLSGQLSGPNLHFHVENVWSETVPVRFVGADGIGGCTRDPVEGDSVARPAGLRDSLLAPDGLSDIPISAFAHAGITQIQGLPGRLFSRSTAYDLRGLTEAGATTVALMIFEEGGGDVVHGLSLPVDDGMFEGSLDLGTLAAGRYGWAMVATEGEIPESPIAIWLTVVD